MAVGGRYETLEEARIAAKNEAEKCYIYMKDNSDIKKQPFVMIQVEAWNEDFDEWQYENSIESYDAADFAPEE